MKKSKHIPYILLSFAVIIVLVFLIIPTFVSLNYSLKNYVLTKPDEIHFIGLGNYIKFFTDADLRTSIFNTVYILIFLLIFIFLGSIFGALFVNKIKKGRQVFLSILILPWALPGVVNALLWGNLFSASYGAINGLLFKIGIIDNYIIWTKNAFVAINLICLIVLWKSLPITIVMVLAAIQAIPEELYEVAKIDGADNYRCFLHITFPIIRPTVAIVLSTTSIGAINVFDPIYILVGLRKDTMSLAMQSWQKAFRYLDLGYGSTISYVLLIAGAIFSIIYLRNLYKEIRL